MMKSNLSNILSAKKIKLLSIWIIILLGIILRFYALEKDSYTLDEGASIHISNRPYMEIFQVEEEPNPPLFFSALHFWIKLFGTSEQMTRLLPAIFSILSLFFIYKLASHLFNEQTGFITTLVFTISPHQIYFAQEVRTYSLLFLLTIVSMLYFIRLSDHTSRKNAIIYIFTTVLLLLTHIYGWFVVLSQVLWILFLKRSHLKIWFIIFAIIGLLFSPYLIYFIPTIWKVSGQFWLNRPGLIHFFGSASALMGSTPLFIMYAIAVLLIPIYIFVKKIDLKNDIYTIFFLIFWIFITYILPFSLSQFLTPFFFERYLIVSIFPITLLMLYLVISIPQRPIRILFIILIIIFSVFENYQDYIHPTREPWRDLATELNKTATEQDIFVVAAGFCIENILDHYTTSLSQKRIGVLKEDMQETNWRDNLKLQINPKSNFIWLILSHFNSNEEKLKNWFDSTYQINDTFEYSHRDIFGRWVTNIKMYKYNNIYPEK